MSKLVSRQVSQHFARVGDMTWPVASDKTSDLSWRVRYSPEFDAITDRYVVASIIDAYIEIVRCDATKREAVVKALGSLPFTDAALAELGEK